MDIDATLTILRRHRVTKATFANDQLASVEFAEQYTPTVSPSDEDALRKGEDALKQLEEDLLRDKFAAGGAKPKR